MDIIIRVAVGAITEVVKYLVSPFTHHVSYLVHHKKNANDLKNLIAMLGEKKADVQRSVDEARTRGDVIKVVVEGWLTRVDQMQSKEMTLNKTLEDSKGCLQGGCSARYKVGKDAEQMIDKVKELLNEGRTFDVVSIPAPMPPSLETMQMLDFQVYDSTKLAMDQIMEALKHEDVNMVGVYGLGGVGKTTLMKEVAKILKKDEFFDQVVMVTVSQDPVWTKIQGEIGENLGLPLTPESLSVRARLLLERLKKEKRILIILDDLWKPLNLLEQVGIPSRNNCKVVLTTRQLEVCNQMETQFNVEVKVLSQGDSWVLFKRAAGDHIEDDNMLCPVAEQIVKECGGLPLAIITIGRALRAKDYSEWEDAASQLKKSSSSPPDIEGVHEKVFCSIKLSYDSLASDVTKFCFLLCCMFPEDSLISEDDLLPYVVGEGVFGNINGTTLREARNRLHTQMQRLKRSCLLLGDSGRKEGCVRMHDIIRDVSLWIASTKEGHDFVVESGRPLITWPDGETLRKCKRLSFMGSEITKLPNQLDCSQLMTLSLRDNMDLTEIPDGFFQGMMSLKTLDIERTDITSMPSSLSCLTNLRVLRISRSIYRSLPPQPLDVSLLGNLKKLEILHLHLSNVEKLPKEIGELTNLKSLNLSQNWNLNIATNTLSRLSLLEELDLEHSFEKWQMEGSEEQEEDGLSKACLSEIASLSALTTLKIGVLNVKCFCANIPYRWENLTHFSISLGGYRPKKDYVSGKCTTSVFIYGSSISPLTNWVRMYLFERAEGIHVLKCPGFKHVLSLGLRGLNNLKILYVQECYAVEYLLDTVVDEEKDHEVVPQIAFINLESLSLLSLPILKAVYRSGSLPLPSGGCFNKLRFLEVFDCDSLISVIPSDLLAKLPNLELLQVGYCHGVTEVFNSKGLGLGQGTMTKLKRLHLQSLPSLMTIWEGAVSPLSLLKLKEIYVKELRLKFIFSLAMVRRFQQLKQLEIWECPEMEQIFSLEEGDELQLNSSSTNNINSPSSSSLLPRPTPIFGNLKHLQVHSCNSLKHILPLSLALQSLLQLEELEIHYCCNLEEIIVNNDDDDLEDQKELVMSKTVLFPRLRILEFEGLPNLLMVSKGILHHHDYWPSLETLRVRECPNLKRLPLSLETTTTKLREIVVEEEWFNGLECDDHGHQIDHNKVLHHLQERIKKSKRRSF